MRRVHHPVRPQLTELGRFLTARRAAISPDQVGLPAAGRRRTPGLRREEVALLAGVGVSWYTWIEQGRAENVSGEVLDAVARVLLLDESQRRYLRRLAGAPAPPPRPRGAPGAGALRPFVDNWSPSPAYIADSGWNIVVANDTAAELLHIGSRPYNLLRAYFLDDRVRAVFPDWKERAPGVVARFRGQTAEYAAEEGVRELVGELASASSYFAELWRRHEVGEDSCGVEVLAHPRVGELHFERTTLDFTPRLGVRLTVYLPLAGTGTDTGLCELVSQVLGYGSSDSGPGGFESASSGPASSGPAKWRSARSRSVDICRRPADPTNLLSPPPC